MRLHVVEIEPYYPGQLARKTYIRTVFVTGRVFAILKTAKSKHVEDHAKADEFQLDKTAMKQIDEMFQV